MTRKHQRRLREGLFGGLVAVVLVLGLAANSAAQTPTPVRRTSPTLLLRLTPTPLPRTTPTPFLRTTLTPFLRTTPTPLRRTTATPSPTPVVCLTSTSIAVGRSVNGQITTTAPIVCYQFQGRRGDKITLTMTKTKGTTTFDPTLELRSPRNFRVIDDVAKLDAKISQTLSSDGVYTIVASSSKNQGIGSYTLSLTRQ